MPTNDEYVQVRIARAKADGDLRTAQVLAELQAENERLRGELQRWPRVFWTSHEPKSLTEGYRVLSVDLKTRGDEFCEIVVEDDRAEDGTLSPPDDFGLYSTREAAEAARSKA